MCDLEPALQVDLMLDAHLQAAQLPEHPQIKRQVIPTLKPIQNRYTRWAQEGANLLIRGGLVPRVYGTGKGKIWHSTYYTTPLYWRGKQVVTVYDLVYVLFPDLFSNIMAKGVRRIQAKAIKSADMVVCISEATRAIVEERFGVSRSCVVPLSVSGNFYFAPHEMATFVPPLQSPYMLYVGARAPHKNFDLLLQAYSVWKQRKTVTLVIVGSSWTPEEERRLVELGIQDQVRLLTGVDDDRLRGLYNQAAAFLYPSLYEGFGIPLLEAMACGCSIVASRIPSTTEVAGDLPFYFEPTSVEGLVAALDAVLSESRESERVQGGLARIKQYSWERTAKETLDVYRLLA